MQIKKNCVNGADFKKSCEWCKLKNKVVQMAQIKKVV